MKPADGTPIWLEVSLASTLQATEDCCQRLRTELRCLPNAADRFACELVCREALQNALEHGNHFDPQRRIHLRLSVTDGVFRCRVSDEGPGFLPAHPVQNDSDQYRESGRGLIIMETYTSHWHLADAGRTIVCERQLSGTP